MHYIKVIATQGETAMGTPARIYVKNTTERGGYDSIRVNYDGMDVGQCLIENYTDPALIAKMLALGECSSLGNDLDGGSIFYHRDRGESLKHEWFRTTADVSEDYTYRYEDGEWTEYRGGRWKSLR
jgi:hypothetical protein